MEKKSWWLVLGVVLLAIALTYVQVLIIHWAIGLFYKISMMQAFAIIVIMDMFSIAVKRK
jgi:hypothetical protein